MKSLLRNVTYTTLIVSSCCVFLLSCNRQKHHFKEVHAQFLGQEVGFSDLVRINASREIKNLDSLLAASTFKIVTYVDSSACENCAITAALQIRGYQIGLRDRPDIQFVYVFNTPDALGIKERLHNMGFFHYYYVDVNNTFLKDNSIPPYPQFHTFLLENDKVRAVGSPVSRAETKKYYNKIMHVSKR
jgi:hypothetical protein